MEKVLLFFPGVECSTLTMPMKSTLLAVQEIDRLSLTSMVVLLISHFVDEPDDTTMQWTGLMRLEI